jgi:hypothetical protein
LLTLKLALTPNIDLTDLGKFLPDTQRKQTYREGREVDIIAVLAEGEMGVELIQTSQKAGSFLINLVLPLWKNFKFVLSEHKCL